MSKAKDVQVVPLGRHSNVASVSSALNRLGFQVTLVASSKEFDTSKALVLPGVGTFGGAMEYLKGTGLDECIRNHRGIEAPLVGICLGFQILCRNGVEGGRGVISGLGLLEGTVEPIKSPTAGTIMNVGWRRLEPLSQLATEGVGYFCHSYAVNGTNKDFHRARLGDVEIVASVKDKGIVGLQFHPELSGEFGIAALESFLKT